MGRLVLLACTFWISLFEAAAALFDLRGLLITGQTMRRMVAFVLPTTGLRLWRAGRRGLAALMLTFGPALALALGVACLRNWQLNPRRRLWPGTYVNRGIMRIDIPTSNGPVPALHIVPTGGTQAVVCVAHGSGCNKTFYAWDLVDALITRGLAVLLIDLDGHGESPRPQMFPDILGNINDTVAWLKERYARVGVIGMSLGGCIATRAVADGAAADALVVIESPPKLLFTKREVRQEALRLLQPAVLRMLQDGSPYHVVRAWKSPPIRARVSTWDLIARLDLPGSLQRLRNNQAAPPVMLIYGGSDAIVPPAQVAHVRAAAPPTAPFYVLPRASHLSLPIDPRTLRLLADWLGQHLCQDNEEPAIR